MRPLRRLRWRVDGYIHKDEGRSCVVGSIFLSHFIVKFLVVDLGSLVPYVEKAKGTRQTTSFCVLYNNLSDG